MCVDPTNCGGHCSECQTATLKPLRLGQVVKDVDGAKWVFVGWAQTSESRAAFFVHDMTGRPLAPGALWDFHAVRPEAIVRKFPDLRK